MRKTKKMGKPFFLFLFFFLARADVSITLWRITDRVAGQVSERVGFWPQQQKARGSWTRTSPEISPALGGALPVRWSPNFVRWKIWCRRFLPWWWWDERSIQDAVVGGRACGKVVRLTGAWRRVRCFLTSIFLQMGERVPTIRTVGDILWTRISINDNRKREIRLREGYRLWGNFW